MHPIKTSVAHELSKLPALEGVNAGELVRLFGTPPDPTLGDLALPCFSFAKAMRKSPVELSKTIAEQAARTLCAEQGLCETVLSAGPYLNLRLKPAALARLVLGDVEKLSPGDEPQGWIFGESREQAGKSVVIDYSSPNIAKPLGVHHLRSTMIGNSLKRIHEACGARVVGVNHLGDWGTGFGKLIAGFCEAHPILTKHVATHALPQAQIDQLFARIDIAELTRIYVDFSRRIETEPQLEDLGRREFAELEAAMSGVRDADDQETVSNLTSRGHRNYVLWKQIKDISLTEFERVYKLLGVSFVPYPVVRPDMREAFLAHPDTFLRQHGFYTGESYYVAGSPLCKEVIDEAYQKGVAVESDGALVIYTDGKDKPPVILLKSDGATSYHTREIASALYRAKHFGMHRGLYVVGSEQRLHFKQLIAALRLLGYEWAEGIEHVDFGMLLMKDEESGQWSKSSTRRGKSVLLDELLAEAIAAVRAIIVEKNPELAADATKLDLISTRVGVAAVVFHDLKHGRRNDVKFDWDEMLSFSGETGPYMLYQYVRLGSVRRKFVARYGQPLSTPDYTQLGHPAERALLVRIAAFPETVIKACHENEPSVISRYLLDLSSEFASYWNATREEGIVGEDPQLSAARIALVSAVRKVLGKGLGLLGIALVEEM